MWDKGNLGTFDKIPNLVKDIIDMIESFTIRNIRFYIIQNKTDLELKAEEESDMKKIENEINTLKNVYKDNLYEVKISLSNKDGIHDLLLNISKTLVEFGDDHLKNNIKFKYPIQLIENINHEETINICLVGNKGAGKKHF